MNDKHHKLKFFESDKQDSPFTVLFVHNYRSSVRNILPYIRTIREMGFDCAAFNLDHSRIKRNGLLWWLSKKNRRGHRQIWAEQILSALNQIDGPVLIYSLSFPSVSALQAINTLDKVSPLKICGWISQGGPFLNELECSWRLFTYAFPIENKIKRLLMTAFAPFSWGVFSYTREIKAWIKNLDPNFPVLSIRECDDIVVPMYAIDKVFKSNPKLNLNVLEVPGAGHLQALKKNKDFYLPRLEQFLSNCLHS